jgi:hypothetical protein
MITRIDIFLSDDVSSLTEALKALAALRANPAAQQPEILKTEVDVCLVTRSIYARYVKCASSSGVSDADTEMVQNALFSARDAVRLHEQSAESIRRRCKDFIQFASELKSDRARGVSLVPVEAV